MSFLLHNAVINSDATEVRRLLSMPDVNVNARHPDRENSTALMEASSHTNSTITEILLKVKVYQSQNKGCENLPSLHV